MNSKLIKIALFNLLLGIANLGVAEEHILQAVDYPTISAIQLFGKALKGFENPSGILIDEGTLRIDNEFKLHISDQAVQVGIATFPEPETMRAFKTLFQALNDNFGPGEEFDIYVAQWSSSVYSSLTEIIINVGCEDIISLTEKSNGPISLERHYDLYINNQHVSYFFKHCEVQ